jgi:hypothetical protein
MADVRAVKNGNWSDTTVWNTGALPTTADDVFSNTFTVSVDTSFEVLSLRSTSGTGITAGGTFSFNTAGISGSCTRTAANTSLVPGATNLVQVTATTGTVTISLGSSVTAFATSTTNLILHSGNCNLILSGSSFNGNTVTNINTTRCISKTSGGTITINGNLNGGTNGQAAVNQASNSALNSSAGNTVVIGNVVGGTFGAGDNNVGIVQTAGTLTIIGNITGGQPGLNGGTHQGVSFSGTSLIITGSVTGGSTSVGVSTTAASINISGSIVGGSSVVGLGCSSAATINIVGPITPSSTATALSLSGASVLTYSGSLTSANNVPAIVSSNVAATNIFTGPFINTNDTMAVQCADINLTADASTTWNFGNITLFSPERLAFYPSASDIRQGTTYADGTVSGSLAMPPATAVIAGTPTDNTTGSAVLTPAQLQDAVWGRDLSQMTETGSIGNRLARVSTTGTTGAQIASYLL